MLPLAISQLSFAAIQALVAAGLRESRTLDFKRDLVGGKDEDKREFLADLSALANTAGGDLVYGIEEAAGEAVGIPGIGLPDPDAEITKLDAVVRSGLEPRLPGAEFQWLPGPAGRGVLVVRVPRSFAAPHRVTFRGHDKFYGRNSASKYPLDVSELRNAFLSADSLVQSIRRFRTDRLAAIEAGEAAVPLRSSTNIVLHIVPLSSFGTHTKVVVGINDAGLIPLASGSGWNFRHTLEGFATYTGPEGGPDGARSYSLLFRSGAIEAVAAIGGTDEEGRPYLPAYSIEEDIVQRFGPYLRELKERDVHPPFYIFLSLLGVRGTYLASRDNFRSVRHIYGRDALVLPEIVITDFDATPSVLRPLFDMAWNAYGFPRSFNFDQNGKYLSQGF